MYQFIHTESYARSAPKTAKTSGSGKAGKNINYVINEAKRADGAHPHIESPEPPVLLFGQPLESIEGLAESWANSVTDSAGRKIRKDGLCLLAGVVSAPNTIKDWEKFRDESVDFLQKKYGNCLKTVIEHTDETHPHIHFYVIPEHGQAFNTVHQGRAASAAAKESGALKGAQNQAYKAAMREFQDEFYKSVGIENGMARVGPGRRRLSRKDWQHEKQQAQALSIVRTRARAVQFEAVDEAEQIVENAKKEVHDFKVATVEKAREITEKAEEKGFKSGLEKAESLSWFKRFKLIIASITAERDTLKVENNELKNENSGLLARAKKYFENAKELKAENAELKKDAVLAKSLKVENKELKKEVEKLYESASAARSRAVAAEAALWTSEANAEPPARASSGLSMGSTLDPALAESRARCARSDVEYGM